mgnify:CR=1 FL=1
MSDTFVREGLEYVVGDAHDAVIECADKYNMVMAFTGMRLFHH